MTVEIRKAVVVVSAWVAETQGDIVGYALGMVRERSSSLLIRARRWYEFEQLVVDPAWRRRGIARRLVETVVVEANRQGLTTIDLNVWAFNKTAQRLFDALGFVPSMHRLERRATETARH